MSEIHPNQYRAVVAAGFVNLLDHALKCSKTTTRGFDPTVVTKWSGFVGFHYDPFYSRDGIDNTPESAIYHIEVQEFQLVYRIELWQGEIRSNTESFTFCTMGLDFQNHEPSEHENWSMPELILKQGILAETQKQVERMLEDPY